MRLDLMAEPVGQAIDCPLEPRVLERSQAPAVVTDRVMMVMAAGNDRLVTGPAVADLDPLHQTASEQQVNSPVDAGGADPLAAGPDPFRDLLSTEAAVLAGEQLDHRSPRPAGSTTLAGERLQRQFRPATISALVHG